MIGSDTSAKAEWVERVLGVAIPEKATDLSQVREIWREASQAADAQVAALQAALRENGDEELEEIAEYGLSGVTGNFRVPLMAGLAELERAGAAGKLLEVIKKFRAHVEGSEKIKVCDDNPFGVPMSLRQTLGAALSRMESEIARAA